MNGLIFDSHAHYDDKAFDPTAASFSTPCPKTA